ILLSSALLSIFFLISHLITELLFSTPSRIGYILSFSPFQIHHISLLDTTRKKGTKSNVPSPSQTPNDLLVSTQGISRCLGVSASPNPGTGATDPLSSNRGSDPP
ncbi:hypothetical protein F2P56_025670, partial [Juglans regia]